MHIITSYGLDNQELRFVQPNYRCAACIEDYYSSLTDYLRLVSCDPELEPTQYFNIDAEGSTTLQKIAKIYTKVQEGCITIEEALLKACEEMDAPAAALIITHPLFPRISRETLGKALVRAVEMGSEDIIMLLLASSRCHDIPMESFLTAAQAARIHGNIELEIGLVIAGFATARASDL